MGKNSKLIWLMCLSFFLFLTPTLNGDSLRELSREVEVNQSRYLEVLRKYQSGNQDVDRGEVDRAFQNYLNSKSALNRSKGSTQVDYGPSEVSQGDNSSQQVDSNGVTSSLGSKGTGGFLNALRSVFEKIKLFFKGSPGGPEIFPEPIYAVVTANSSLNLRNLPTTDSRVLDAMPRGTRVKVLGRMGDWIIVEHNGVVGYAHGNFLRRVEENSNGNPDGSGTGSPGNDGQMSPEKPSEGTSAPPQKKVINYPAGSVNTHNGQFNNWMGESQQAATRLQEYFPTNLSNKYGQPITKEMAVKAVLYSESRGVHSTPNGGVIQNKWGFTGWMQISKNVAKETLGDNHTQWKDPKFNLMAGTKYLGTCMMSSAPPPKSWKIWQPGDSDEDRLIKGIVGYNRGPYHKRLKQSWDQVVKSTKPSGEDYMAEGVNYGIQAKMGMGLELSRAERDWLIAKNPKINNDSDVDRRTLQVYHYVQEM